MLTRSRAAKRKAEDSGLVQGSYDDVAEFPNDVKRIIRQSHPEAVPRKSPKPNFKDLPAEVVLMIFKYLDTFTIALSVLPVCKRWYNIGRNPVLWKKVRVCMAELDFSTSLTNCCTAIIQRASFLRILTLHISGEVSTILESVGNMCPLLDTLSLSECSLNCDRAVQRLVSGCLRLKRLRLHLVIGSALKEFAELKTLETLEMHRIHPPSDGFLHRLSMNSRHLKTLKLFSEFMCRDEHIVPLLTNLRSVLTKVYLSAPLSRSRTYQTISKCANLESIKLLFPGGLVDSDLLALGRLKKLKRIHIRMSYFHRLEAWKSFLTNVRSDHIEYVCLLGCENVDGLLSEVLSTRDDTILHRAKSISLVCCTGITENVLRLILTVNPSLEKLCLCGSGGFRGSSFNTSDTSIAPLLRRLDVRFCYTLHVSNLVTFLKNRPNLQVLVNCENSETSACHVKLRRYSYLDSGSVSKQCS